MRSAVLLGLLLALFCPVSISSYAQSPPKGWDEPQPMQVPQIRPPDAIEPASTVPGTNNSCKLAFNNVCDEPAKCEAGTDSHDCVPRRKP